MTMKKLVAFGLMSVIMTVGVTLSTHATTVKRYDQTCKLERYSVSVDFSALTYINDAVSPAVSPVYGKCVYVHALDVAVSASFKEVTPAANSPPTDNQGEI